MTNHVENEGTDYKYEVLVTTSRGEVISHTEATAWDVDDLGRLFLYNETTTHYNLVATYNAGAWEAITRVTEEVYNKVMANDKANDKANKESWLAKRESNRRKVQGH